MATDVDDRTEKSIRTKQTIRIVLLLVIVGIFAWWALANDDDTQVDWLFDTTTAPLVVVILTAAAIGFVVGLLAGWRRR